MAPVPGPGFGPESLHPEPAAGGSGVLGRRVVDAFGTVCLRQFGQNHLLAKFSSQDVAGKQNCPE